MLIGRKHAATTVYQRGRMERRIWDLESGKLVEKKNCGHGFLTTQEGAVLQVTSQGIEKLASKVKKPAPKPAPEPDGRRE